MTKGRHSTCSCGKQVQVVRYIDGKKTCHYCQTANLSGSFLRRMDLERHEFAKDILQKGDEGFEELYGKGKNIK